MATPQSNIRAILGAHANTNSILAEAIFIVLKDKKRDEQVELLSICLLEKDPIKRNSDVLKNKGLTDKEWRDYNESHLPMINAHLRHAFFRLKTVSEFAKQILKLVDFYETESEKIFCLSICLISEFVPFHELPGDGSGVTTERFSHLLQVNDDKVQLIDYIVKLPIKLTTDEASYLLNILDEIEDNQELRISLFAYYIGTKSRKLSKSTQTQ